MGASVKVSRRRVTTTLIDMLASGTSTAHVAEVLAAYLVETRQTRNLDLYLRDLELAIAQRFGIVTTYVYSASVLSRQIKSKVEQLVKAHTSAKAVEMIEEKDPSLIGGIVVKTADAELDGSVRTKLRNLRSI